MSTESPTQPSVLLSLGIYPTIDGKYIALPYSPPDIIPKIDFPLIYFTGNISVTTVRYVLGILSAALEVIEERQFQTHMRPIRGGQGKAATNRTVGCNSGQSAPLTRTAAVNRLGERSLATFKKLVLIAASRVSLAARLASTDDFYFLARTRPHRSSSIA